MLKVIAIHEEFLNYQVKKTTSVYCGKKHNETMSIIIKAH